MCIIKMLKSEQITLMQYAAATDLMESRKHKRKLLMFKHMLAAHPYAHRPYSQGNIVECPLGPDQATTHLPLAAWNNDEGEC